MKQKKIRGGFTIVELLVVTAVIGILSSVSIVALNRAKDREIAVAASRDIASAIRKAQHLAITGKNVGDGNRYPCAYIFQVDPSDNERETYKILYKYHTGGDCLSTEFYTQKLKRVSMEFIPEVPPGCAPDNDLFNKGQIIFNVPYGTTNIPASSACSGSNVSIQVKTISGDIAATICVYPNGNITEHKGQHSC